MPLPLPLKLMTSGQLPNKEHSTLSNCVIGGRCAERNARSDWLNPYLTDRQIAVGSDMTNEMQLSATR